jgi:hypothetical protein
MHNRSQLVIQSSCRKLNEENARLSKNIKFGRERNPRNLNELIISI